MSPAPQKSLRHQLAAHARLAQYDSRELTKAAREARDAKFERQVDPEGKLSPDERAKRAAHARKAHMLRLAYQSAKARAARKAATP